MPEPHHSATASTPPQKPAYLTVEGPILVCTEEGAKLAHQLIDDAITEPTYDDIFHAMRALERALHKSCPDLNKKNPTLANKHKQKIMQAQWMVLERLLPDEIEVLFKESLEHLFEQDNEEIVSALRRILHALIVDFNARDVQKKKWQEAMAHSAAKIGAQPLTVNGVAVEPTVQQWLKLWKEFVGDRAVDPLQVVEFMNSTTPVNTLPEDERKKLEQLLKLYIELSKSSQTPEGNEEKLMFVDPVTGTIKSYERGQISDTGVAASPDEVEYARAVYNVDEQGHPRTTAQVLKHSILMRYAKPELFEQHGKETIKTIPPTPVAPAPVAPPLVRPVVSPTTPTVSPATQVPVPAPLSKPAPPATPSRVPTAPKGIDHAAIAQRVLAAHKLLLPTLELEHRFLSIITSYLKGVRDSMEAREALTGTPEQGGVSMTASHAEEVLVTADEELNAWKQHPEQRRTLAPKQAPPMPTLAMVRQRIEEQKRNQPQQPVSLSQEEPVDIFGASTAPITPVPSTLTTRPAQPLPPTPVAPRRISSAPKKGPQPTVMGPIDELKQLTVEEFRTLGPDSRTASRAIIEKIHLLEQESIERKTEAISAWKSSPLHQRYLDIGNQSLESTLPVEAVIKQREKNRQPSLTVEEFDAVADINRQLRF